MKKLILSLFLLASIGSVSGQIRFKHSETIRFNSPNVIEEFVKANNPEFALVAWYTGTMKIKDEYACLFRTGKDFTLAKISVGYHRFGKMMKDTLMIRQQKLTPAQSSKLINSLKIDLAFEYSQKDFDAITKGCRQEENGVISDLDLVDGTTNRLLRFSGGKMDKLEQYAAEYQLENCLKLTPQLHLLQGMVHTFKQLNKIVQETEVLNQADSSTSTSKGR